MRKFFVFYFLAISIPFWSFSDVANHPSTNEIDSLYDYAWNLLDTRPDQSIELFEIQLEKSKSVKYDKGVVNAYRGIGIANYNLRNYDNAAQNILSGIEVIHANFDPDLKRKLFLSLQDLAEIFQKSELYEYAIQYATEAKEISIELNDSLGAYDNLVNIALAQNRQGKFNLAKSNYQKALNYFTKIDDNYRIVMTYNNIAICAKSSDNVDQAMKHYSKAIDYARKLSDNEMIIARLSTNVGQLKLKEKKFAESIDWFEKSRGAFEKLNKDAYVSWTNYHLGEAYERIGETDKSIEHYALSVKQADTEKYISETLAATQALSKIYENKGDLEKSKYYSNLALSQSTLFINQIKMMKDIDMQRRVLMIVTNHEKTRLQRTIKNLLVKYRFFLVTSLFLITIGLFMLRDIRRRSRIMNRDNELFNQIEAAIQNKKGFN